MAFPENTVNDTGIKHIWDKVTAALSGKVDKVSGKSLSTNDYTTAEKDKLAGIESGAQVNPTIDSALSGTSTNAVQNKVVTAALNDKVSAEAGKGLSTNDYTNEEKALVETIPDKADADDVKSTQTVTGNPITLTDASETYAQGLSVELEPKQDLHGQSAPYVGGAGKNKADIHFSISDSYCDSAVSLSAGQYIASLFDQNFTHDGMVAGVNFSCFLMDGNGQNIKSHVQNGTTLTAEDASQITTLRYYFDRGQYSGTSTEFYGQLETGNTVTDFAPYSNICPISGYEGVEVTTADSATDPTQSRTASVTFGQTVYGGKSDFTEGGTDKTYGYDADLGAAGRPWWAEGDGVFRTELLSSKFKGRLNCSMYKGVQKDWPDDGEITVTNSQAYQLLRIKDPTCVGYTVAEFANHISGCQLAYELATPTQLSTPPTELKLLQDTNNLSTNGTTITLDYIPNNSIGDAVKASEEYTDRAVGRVAPKATLIDTWMISEEADTISVDLSSYDCNFFLLEYLFQSKRGTTLIPRTQGFSASVVTYNNGTAYYIELDYNPTTKQLSYTSNITSQFGILAIYTI